MEFSELGKEAASNDVEDRRELTNHTQMYTISPPSVSVPVTSFCFGRISMGHLPRATPS